MAQGTEKEILGSGAGMSRPIALESGVELGEIEVKARGYWEQVWRRFRRDKIAIAGGDHDHPAHLRGLLRRADRAGDPRPRPG